MTGAENQKVNSHQPTDSLDDATTDKEIRRMQDGIRDHLIKLGAPDNLIDGAGCDSGDPLDFTTAEITQAFNYFEDQKAAASPQEGVGKACSCCGVAKCGECGPYCDETKSEIDDPCRICAKCINHCPHQ